MCPDTTEDSLDTDGAAVPGCSRNTQQDGAAQERLVGGHLRWSTCHVVWWPELTHEGLPDTRRNVRQSPGKLHYSA